MNEYDDSTEHTLPEEPLTLERFTWHDGSWVEFIDLDRVTRSQIKELRKAFGSSENLGEAGHAGLDRALTILISGWEIKGQPDLQVPKHARQGNPLDKIPGLLGSALERHIRPFLRTLREGEGEDSKS